MRLASTIDAEYAADLGAFYGSLESVVSVSERWRLKEKFPAY